MASHLTSVDRDRIAQLFAGRRSPKEIAVALGRSPSTIYRELKRNAINGEYLPCQAHGQAERRRSERPLVLKCDRPAVDRTIRRLLSRSCSPDQIAQRMKYDRPDRPEDCVSASTIYRWINQRGEDREYWSEYLRHRGRRPYKAREKTSSGAPIADRPQVVEERGRIGDFEGDLVLGKQGTGGLQTLVDRKSRYTILMKVVRKEASYVYRQDQNVVRRLMPDSLAGILDCLPLLDTGEAVLLGDSVLLPARIKLNLPKIEPLSATRAFWTEWGDKEPDKSAVIAAVETLRRQSRAGSNGSAPSESTN